MSIVEAAGGLWSYVGWGLFLLVLLLPYVAFSTSAGLTLWLLSALLLIIWWITDVTSQMVPWWMILAGLVLIGLGLIQRILLIACWVIYWTKVRE